MYITVSMLRGVHPTDSSDSPVTITIADTDVTEMTAKEKKQIAMKKVQPILESSDELRQNLRNIDINLMVRYFV